MDRHQKTSSKDIFSFPSTPSQDQDSDFEFGSLTPDSPSVGDPYKTSPADHLFYNGRLLPHSFPLQQQQQTPIVLNDNLSNTFRASSRTSSMNSKDSLMSSRSNSVNSSRSSVSSRTSWSSTSSDNSERKLLYYSARIGSRSLSSTPTASKVVMAQLYGSSQRWQHIMPIPAAPALKRESSRRKNGGFFVNQQGLMKNRKETSDRQERNKNKKYGICRRFLRSFLVACKECHAMEPSIEDDIMQGNVHIR